MWKEAGEGKERLQAVFLSHNPSLTFLGGQAPFVRPCGFSWSSSASRVNYGQLRGIQASRLPQLRFHWHMKPLDTANSPKPQHPETPNPKQPTASVTGPPGGGQRPAERPGAAVSKGFLGSGSRI